MQHCCSQHFTRRHKVLVWAARVRNSEGHIAKKLVVCAPVSMTRLFKGAVFNEQRNLITLTNTLWNEKHVTGSLSGRTETAVLGRPSLGPGRSGATARAWASQKPEFSASAQAEQAPHYSEEYYDGIWFIAAANPDALFAFSTLRGKRSCLFRSLSSTRH